MTEQQTTHTHQPPAFWREGERYVHRATGTQHHIIRIFRSGPEWIADYISEHGRGQARLSARRPSDYVRTRSALKDLPAGPDPEGIR